MKTAMRPSKLLLQNLHFGSGLNAFAAIRLAEQMEEPCTIVTILCDMGIKYLSKVYDDDWLMEKNLYRNLADIQNNGHQGDPFLSRL